MPYETDRGPFLGVLDWLNGLGEVPLNLGRGNFAGAGRKLADSILDIPDAIIPGDAIPQISRPEDSVTASDVVGIDRAAHPGLAKAVDIIGGTAVNPASWLGVKGGTLRAGAPWLEGAEVPGVAAAVDKAKALAGTGYSQLPESLRRTAANTAQGVRRTANWLDVPDDADAFLRQAKASGNNAGEVARQEVERIYQPLTPPEREAVGEVAHQINRNGTDDRSKWSVLNDPEEIIANRPDIRPDVVRQAVADRQKLMNVIADESPDAGVMNIPEDVRNKNYISRQFGGAYFDDGSPLTFKRTGGSGDAIKERSKAIASPTDLLDFMRKQDVDLEFDALKADMGRANQQSRLVEKGAVGKQLAGQAGLTEPFLLSDAKHRTAISQAIGDIEKQPGMADYGYKLRQVWDGMTPRSDNFFVKGLHQANKLFKGAATYGIVLPRLSFDVRNRTSALWQALSNPQSRQTLGDNAKRTLSDLYGAFDDGFQKLTGGKKGRLSNSDLTQKLDFIDSAFQEARGSTVKLREILSQHPEGDKLLGALDNGVLNNFVDSEQLLSRMASTPTKQRVNDIMQWPAEVAQGLEQRMRLGTYFDLLKGAKPIAKDAADAAKTIRDTYLDYDVAGTANRTLRDLVPFASFLTQNVKQQSKFLLEKPVVGVASAQVFGDHDNLPKYPWLEEQMSIPIGLDEKQNPQYLSGLGLPIEGLTQVPGLGADDAYGDVVGSLQPFLKSAISYAADKDPLTGRRFGEYDKIFGEPAGAAGRAYNVIKGTGLAQPITGPIGQAENLFDERKSAAQRVLQATTGARFTSVDPALANRQHLENYLKTRPDVHTSETLYQTGQDPELAAELKKLQAAKKALSQKRKAEAAL